MPFVKIKTALLGRGLFLIIRFIYKGFKPPSSARPGPVWPARQSPSHRGLRSRRGICGPVRQAAEIALFGAAVAVCILAGFFNSLNGGAEAVLPAAVIAFRLFDDFFMSGAGSGAAFNSGHYLPPSAALVAVFFFLRL